MRGQRTSAFDPWAVLPERERSIKIGNEHGKRALRRAPLHRVHLLNRVFIVAACSQAIDRFGGQGDPCTATQKGYGACDIVRMCAIKPRGFERFHAAQPRGEGRRPSRSISSRISLPSFAGSHWGRTRG